MADYNKSDLERISHQLDIERSSFDPHWKSIAEYILPRRYRWFLSDVNKGDPRNYKIVDGTATYAMRTLRSGMMSGITSPARPWVQMGIEGHDTVEPGPVNEWLAFVTREIRAFLSRTNFYQMLPMYYGDLGGFGTSCMYVEEEEDRGGRFEIIPLGSFSIAKGHDGRINTLSRKFMMTVSNVIDKFGEENVSTAVKHLARANRLNDYVSVRHIVLPNRNHNPNKLGNTFKQFSSYYYELAVMPSDYNVPHEFSLDQGKFLRKSGYDLFPFFVARWETLGEDVYGTSCPGMEILGDTKELQLQRRRLMQAIDKKVNPPLIAPSSMKASPISVLPGDITYADIREGLQGLRAAHEVNFETRELAEEMQRTRERIRIGTFENLFLMLANSDRREITAREIEERHEEKLWALGPVLEGLNKDFLDPLIDWIFAKLVKDGRIPDPPSEIQGARLKVEYVSVMARAMKMVDLGTLDRFMTFVSNYAQLDRGVLDKIDSDQVIDLYADMTGVPSGVVRSDEDVAKIREQRVKAQQQQQQLEALNQAAQAAKTASEANLGGDNVLSQALGGANPGGVV